MVRNIAPGNPPAIEAKQYNVPQTDFSYMEKLGDAKIKTANQNFKLYAEALVGGESAKLYDQYKTDPVNLANALGKLPDMLKDLPEEVQAEMNKKLYLNSVALVMKARDNQTQLEDAQNKEYADYSIVSSKEGMLASYGNVLRNAVSKADEKDPVMNKIYLGQVDNLRKLSELKNSRGLDAYSPTQRKAIRNTADVQLEAFKRFVDGIILNDDDELTNTKDYYQQHILAPERFMEENYMDRPTYDKARSYIEKTMKDTGVKIKELNFKQSVKDYMDLQLTDAPGRLEELRSAGWLDKGMIDQMEKVNVKFNEIDPSKTESPIAMLDMLEIVNSWERLPADATEEQRLTVLAEGTMALDAIANLATTYGLSEDNVNRSRKMVVLKESDALYGEMLDNFGKITQSFGVEIPHMQEKMAYIRGEKKNALASDFYMPTREEIRKLTELNEVLAIANDKSSEAIRQQDVETYNQIQSDLRKRVAQIKYKGIIDDYQWIAFGKDPDFVFETPDGVSFQIAGFSPVGDVITK